MLTVCDETLVFFEASKSSIKMLKLILYGFELATDLKINFQKIHLVGMRIKNELTNGLAAMLGCWTTTLPIGYQEIPLHHSVLRKRD